MMELGIDVIKNYEEFYERKLKIDHLVDVVGGWYYGCQCLRWDWMVRNQRHAEIFCGAKIGEYRRLSDSSTVGQLDQV